MTRSRVFQFSIFFACMASAAPLLAGDTHGEWHLIDEAEGIRVSQLEIPGQELPGFRGEALVSAPIDAIVAVLRDVAHHTAWMHNCVGAELLEQLSPDRAIVYNRTDTPWPVWNRDVVLDTVFERNADGRLVTLTFKNTDPKRRALPEHVVRMPRLVGFYKMWQFAPEKTKVTYQVEADVGGTLPRWLAERAARDMPFKTLASLRKRLAKR